MKESKKKIEEDKKVIKRLKIACENIKKTLSYDSETNLYINNFYNNKDIEEYQTRCEFENLCEDLFKRLEMHINEALINANLNKDEIGEIIMVGGSSIIPKIKTILQKCFKNPSLKIKKINEIKEDSEIQRIYDYINPDETLAYGATLMAAKILIKKI